MNRTIFYFALCLLCTLLSNPVSSREINFSENIAYCASAKPLKVVGGKAPAPGWLPPAIVACGEMYFDPGGPNGDFQPGQSDLTTICPDSPGEYVVMDFSSFDLGNCCEAVLDVYMGETLDFLIHSFNASSAVNIVTSYEPGCLTFNFTAPLNATPAAGWEAAAICTTCPPPVTVNVFPIGPSAIDISWFSNDPSSNYLLEIGNQGFAPGQNEAVYTEVVNTDFTQVFGLPSGSLLEVYVSTLCSNGDTSVYFGPVPIQTAPGCGDFFYDSGGPNGNFPASDFFTLDICPEPGEIVQITFDSFDLGPCCNTLQVFSSNFTGIFEGTNSPGTISASFPDECMHIVFDAPGQMGAPGWEATVSCITCPPPFNVTANQIGSTTATFNWSYLPTASFYYYEIGQPGFVPGTGQQLASANTVNTSVVIPGLQANTPYELAVRAHCGNTDTSAFSMIIPFMTSPSCGDNYYDPGGPNGNYAGDVFISSVICPDQSGSFVQIDFDSFSIDPCCAVLEIYDGNNFGGFFLGSWTGQNSPGAINATNPSGCLSIFFYPNGSTAYGWDATITCITCPAPGNVTVNVFNSNIDISWPQVNPANSYNIEIGTPGFTPGTGAALISEAAFQPFLSTSGLPGGEMFEVYVQSVCGVGDTSPFGGPFSFTTPPSCGDTFYDAGGPNGDHPTLTSSETIICPNAPDVFAQVVFTEFDVDPCCNNIFVNDGFEFFNIPLGNEIPGPFTAAFPGGCMNIFFQSFQDHDAGTGWAADVACITCPNPRNVSIFGTTSSSAHFEWFSFFINETIQWEIGLPGFVPGTNNAVSAGTTPSSDHIVEAGGLMANTAYELYVKNICQNDSSTFTGPIAFTTSPSCGDPYFDPGGPDNDYGINQPELLTIICPDIPNTFVEVTFSEFSLSPFSNDLLEIYNGPNLNAPFMGNFWGNDLPPTLTSTDASGCLTFLFRRFSGEPFPGWKANVECVTCPRVSGITAIETNTTNVTIAWDNLLPADVFFWEIGTLGFQPSTGEALQSGSVNGTQTTQLIQGLTSGTFYEVYVWAECGPDKSDFGTPYRFSTQPTCGDIFYDPGGPNAAYQNNSNYITTICPPHDGVDITVSFNLFNTQSCCDFLTVFDGPNTNSSFLGNFSGSLLPGPFTSTHPSGCLTFHFSSDNTGGGNGWEAVVSCNPLDAPTPSAFAGLFQVAPNPTSAGLNVLFDFPATETVHLEVHDITGRLVFGENREATIGRNQTIIEMGNLPDGAYFVSLKSSFGRAVERVIKLK